MWSCAMRHTTAIVFPYFFDAKTDRVVVTALRRTLWLSSRRVKTIFVADGEVSDAAMDTIAETLAMPVTSLPEGDTWFKDPIWYHHFRETRGLTRSWNHGASIAFGPLKCDVCIFSNDDAWPDSERSIFALSTAAVTSDEFVAFGPRTNHPGHCRAQLATPDSPKRGLTPVCWLNGFTWAVTKTVYRELVSARGRFLNGSHDEFFGLTPHGGLICSFKDNPTWTGRSLAYVGQEDELFLWCVRHWNRPCAIVNSSFWHHEKLGSHRSPA